MKLSITHISDTHNKHKKLNLKGGDILIHSGDFTSLGYKHEVNSFLDWFIKQPYQYKVFIAGNHDLSFDPLKNEQTKAYEWLPEMFNDYQINKDNNIFYLENSSIQLYGCLNIWGSPITPDFNPKRWAFNRTRGKDINEIWELIPENLHILVTHGPMFGYLDVNYEGTNIGCEDLRYHINTKHPRIHLCGHIHEAYGMTYNSYTDFLNSCVCDLSYNPINKPINFIFDEENNEIEYIK